MNRDVKWNHHFPQYFEVWLKKRVIMQTTRLNAENKNKSIDQNIWQTCPSVSLSDVMNALFEYW